MELGCGDGRAAVALAGSEPRSLILAVDPDARAMAETSRLARRAVPNVVFLAAGAEEAAACLPACADVVQVLFPWGSLLRGVLGLDPCVAGAMAALVRPGGSVTAMVSVTPRDGVAGLAALEGEAIASLSPPQGLELVSARPADREEIRATRSTWGRRLLAGREPRPVWRLRWRRCG